MIPGECLGVCGQTGCVPSVVASELAAQVVRGDTLAEGTYRKKRVELESVTSWRIMTADVAQIRICTAMQPTATHLTQELCSVWAIELDGCACGLLVALQVMIRGWLGKGRLRASELQTSGDVRAHQASQEQGCAKIGRESCSTASMQSPSTLPGPGWARQRAEKIRGKTW